MTSWHPPMELTRLLEALGEEIAATTEQEVRLACGLDEHSVRETASEVREMIGTLTGDPGDPEPRIAPISLIDMRRAS
jgi:hypothetical protein